MVSKKNKPITGEWLERYGFKKTNTTSEYVLTYDDDSGDPAEIAYAVGEDYACVGVSGEPWVTIECKTHKQAKRLFKVLGIKKVKLEEPGEPAETDNAPVSRFDKDYVHVVKYIEECAADQLPAIITATAKRVACDGPFESRAEAVQFFVDNLKASE